MMARQFFARRHSCQRRGDKTVRHQLTNPYENFPSSAWMSLFDNSPSDEEYEMNEDEDIGVI
jgi:hypothetical protein